MEVLLIFCLIVVLLVRWAILRDRMARMESSIHELSERLNAQSRFIAEIHRQSEPIAPPETAVPEPPPVQAAAAPTPVEAPIEAPAVETPITPPHVPTPREWETALGGNWLNKLGVLVLVIGLGLLLRYSFTQFGPFGRVTICLAASFALLAAGVLFESKERYRVFARGLIGGGWAALYVTVYAMHAVESARVIESPAAGAILLLSVAAGMIAHALRYRSQTVTGLAYFVAFATLGITDMASLPFLASVPLAASLLYIAHRFAWMRMALFGLIATYAVVIIRGDTGAPLWQAQAIFAIYWLLFEIFDVLHPEAWLLPLNAVGALGLSVLKWQTAAPDQLWILLSASAAIYVLSAVARVRSGKWHGAATLTAALAAGAIFQKLGHQWVASALVVEAELFYLAGLRLRSPYLRWMGASLFGVEALRLLVNDIWVLPAAQWTPVASLDALVFYANRALCAADEFYGDAGAAAIALLIGRQAQEPYRSLAWQATAAGAFAIGWWKRLFDFRLQGYLLFAVGLVGTALDARVAPLAAAAAICYTAVLCALHSGADRFADNERILLRWAGSGAAVQAAMALEWRVTPAEYTGVAWMVLALAVLELGLCGIPDEYRRMGYATAAAGACMVWSVNVIGIGNSSPWHLRLIPAWAAVTAYAIAVRARRQDAGIPFIGASTVGLAFGLIALWELLPEQTVAPAWAFAALALLLAARQWKREVLVWQSYAVAGLAYLISLAHLTNTLDAVWPTCAAIAGSYAAQLVSPRDSRQRLYFSMLATTLLTLLLYYRISGSLLTMACGIQGILLLASGFPLRDRVLRISGLALLLACILKLFVYDLRHLDTLPRIFSFIVLGVILLAVSWIYTRFHEHVAKLL